MVLLSSELAGLVPVSYSCGKSTRYSIRLNGFSIVMAKCYKDAFVNRFPLLIVSFWNTVTEECFLLNGFKSRVQRQLLPLRSLQPDFLYFIYLCLLVYYYFYHYYCCCCYYYYYYYYFCYYYYYYYHYYYYYYYYYYHFHFIFFIIFIFYYIFSMP